MFLIQNDEWIAENNKLRQKILEFLEKEDLDMLDLHNVIPFLICDAWRATHYGGPYDLDEYLDEVGEVSKFIVEKIGDPDDKNVLEFKPKE